MTLQRNSTEISDRFVQLLRPLRFRGKARLLEKLVPKTGERFAQVFDCRIRLDLSDHVQRWIYFGNYEQEETQWLREWLRPGMTVVDVGANVGYYSLLAASCVGVKGKVFALEPSPYAYHRLCEAVAANGLSQVVTSQVALSNECGEGVLYLPPPGNHTPSLVPSDRKDSIRVPLRTLDDCLQEWGMPTVDLLKIDVEGFEPQVLAGARAALSTGKIRAVLCELNDWWLRRMGGSAQELNDFIVSEGFVDIFGPHEFGCDSFCTCLFVHRTADPEACRAYLRG